MSAPSSWRAVVASSFGPENPGAGAAVVDLDLSQPEPGWVPVTVEAASLNHHDVWSLKGVGLREAQLPMVLGTDASGTLDDGTPVLVHAVITSPTWRGDETLDPTRSLLSERYPGTLAQRVWVPAGNVVPRPEELLGPRRRLSADRVPHRLPAPLHRRRPAPRPERARPGGGGRRRDRVHPAGTCRGAASARDQPIAGTCRTGARARGTPDARDGGPAAAPGRRRHRDRREGDLVALAALARARWRDRGGGGDHRSGRRRRPQPGVLQGTAGGRDDDGHPTRGSSGWSLSCSRRECGRSSIARSRSTTHPRRSRLSRTARSTGRSSSRSPEPGDARS